MTTAAIITMSIVFACVISTVTYFFFKMINKDRIKQRDAEAK